MSGQLSCRESVRESRLGKGPSEKIFQQSHDGNGNENWLELMRQRGEGEKDNRILADLYAIYVRKVWMIWVFYVLYVLTSQSDFVGTHISRKLIRPLLVIVHALHSLTDSLPTQASSCLF